MFVVYDMVKANKFEMVRVVLNVRKESFTEKTYDLFLGQLKNIEQLCNSTRPSTKNLTK